MSDERNDKSNWIGEDIEEMVDDVNKAVRVVVAHGSDAAESVGESIKGTLKETIQRARAARDSVVMIRVDKDSLARLDELVEAGISNSRSEAAAFLIAEGIKAQQVLFDKIAEKVEQIREAKEELRGLLNEEEGQPTG